MRTNHSRESVALIGSVKHSIGATHAIVQQHLEAVVRHMELDLVPPLLQDGRRTDDQRGLDRQRVRSRCLTIGTLVLALARSHCSDTALVLPRSTLAALHQVCRSKRDARCLGGDRTLTDGLVAHATEAAQHLDAISLVVVKVQLRVRYHDRGVLVLLQIRAWRLVAHCARQHLDRLAKTARVNATAAVSVSQGVSIE